MNEEGQHPEQVINGEAVAYSHMHHAYAHMKHDDVQRSRELSLAITKLEEAMM